MHLGHVAFGNRDKAGQPRLGREQIVIGRIEPAGILGVGEAIADREQLALRIEQEAEVHRVKEGQRTRGERRRDVAQADRQRQQRTGQVPAVNG